MDLTRGRSKVLGLFHSSLPFVCALPRWFDDEVHQRATGSTIFLPSRLLAAIASQPPLSRQWCQLPGATLCHCRTFSGLRGHQRERRGRLLSFCAHSARIARYLQAPVTVQNKRRLITGHLGPKMLPQKWHDSDHENCTAGRPVKRSCLDSMFFILPRVIRRWIGRDRTIVRRSLVPQSTIPPWHENGFHGHIPGH